MMKHMAHNLGNCKQRASFSFKRMKGSLPFKRIHDLGFLRTSTALSPCPGCWFMAVRRFGHACPFFFGKRRWGVTRRSALLTRRRARCTGSVMAMPPSMTVGCKVVQAAPNATFRTGACALARARQQRLLQRTNALS